MIGVAIALVILAINVIVVLLISQNRSGGNASSANSIDHSNSGIRSSPVSSPTTRRIPTNSPLWFAPNRPTPNPVPYYTPYPTRDYTPYPTRDYTPYPTQPPVTSRPTRRATNVGAIVWFINNITLANRTIAAPSTSYYGDDYYYPSSGLPEEDALEWLVERDPLQLLPFELAEQFRLQQRYALLAMGMQPRYYTSLLNETLQRKLENECLWDGVNCTQMDLGGEMGMQNVVTQVNTTANDYAAYLFPADIGLLSHLTSLDATIHTTMYSVELPDSIGRLTNLIHFNVLGPVYGTIPESVGDWTKIQTLSLQGGYSLTGTLPASIGKWTDLRWFYVSSNLLRGSLPDSIGAWANVEGIAFSNNLLTGELPRAEWARLEYIDLSGNRFNGTLPETMAGWSNLRTANFATNELLIGTLPKWIGLWKNLERFDISYTGMGGTIPNEIGNWTNIITVNMASNNFTGSVPGSIGQWTNIEDFSIFSNMLLTGSLPDSIAGWAAVRQIYVYDTGLTGTVPSELCQLPNLVSLAADCTYEVQCMCCSYCPPY
jgi:Leucine-rich repeat (LRR) protein